MGLSVTLGDPVYILYVDQVRFGSPAAMARGLRSKNALMIGCIVFFMAGMLLALTSPATRSAVGKGLGASATGVSAPHVSDPKWRPWLKAADIRVSAVVFYGKAPDYV